MKSNATDNGYSADVRIHLNVNGYVLRVGQLGPDFVILRDPPNHPPSKGEIVLSIDGEESRWIVHLPNGIIADQPETPIISEE